MSWSTKRVLVTGAGGFIGSHLCERLVAEGASVTAFLRYTSGAHEGALRVVSEPIRSAMRMVFGDLRDPEAVRAAVRGQDLVFHLGALIAIPYSYVHPGEVADVNVMGTLNVLNAVRELGVARLVHTSTSEVYGTARSVPIDEDHPLSGQSPYAATKIGADALALSYHRAFGVPVATLRPFNTYGPRQSGRAVLPTIVSQALHGEVVELGSLEPTRDLTFVGDTVAAFLAIAACDAALGRVLNAGNGKEISVGELAKLVISRVGRSVPIVSTETRKRPEASEVFRLVADATRLRAATGWQPRVTLSQGIDELIAFLRANPSWTAHRRYQV